MTLRQSATLLLSMALLSFAAPAATIFDFEGDSQGTSTTFTDTVNGLSATFSSSADPGGFVVYPSIFETLTGNVLGDPGPTSVNNLALNVNFSGNLSAITLDFATSDFITPSSFTITAYENSKKVGSASSKGQFLTGFSFPEAEIAFAGAAFNKVVITSKATDFAVDNIAVAPSTAPEPGTFALLGGGLCLSAMVAMRRPKSSGK